MFATITVYGKLSGDLGMPTMLYVLIMNTPTQYSYDSSTFIEGTIIRTVDGNVWIIRSGCWDFVATEGDDTDKIIYSRLSEDLFEEYFKESVDTRNDFIKTHGKRGRGRPRKTLDIHQPRKREKTKYNEFVKEMMDAFKAELMSLSNHEKMNACAEMWRLLK